MRVLNNAELRQVSGGLLPVYDPNEGGVSGGGAVYTNSAGQATGLAASYTASGSNWANDYDQFNLNGIGSASSGITYNGSTQLTSDYHINGSGSHDIDFSHLFNESNNSQSLSFDIGGGIMTFR